MAGAPQDLEGLEARGSGDRVAGKRPNLHQPAVGSSKALVEVLHDLGPPGDCGQWKPAADDLAKRRDVGRDAVGFLRASIGKPEPGDDFVEDQDDAMPVGFFPEDLQVSGIRWNEALKRLDDDAGHLVAPFRKERANVVRVVEWRDQDFGGDSGRNPGAVRHGSREVHGSLGRKRHLRLGAHAVIAAFELHDLVAACEGAGEPHGVHVRLAARGDVAEMLGARQGPADLFGELDAESIAGEEGLSPGQLLRHGLQNFRVAVAEDQRS